MSSDLDFFDIPSKIDSTKKSLPQKDTSDQESYFDIPTPQNSWLQKTESEPSLEKQFKSAGALFSQRLLGGLWSLPSTTAETWRYLGGKLQKQGERQAAESGREISEPEKAFTSNVVNYVPDLWKKLGEVAPSIAPTHQQALEKVGKKIKEGGGELPEKPRTWIEKFGAGAGDIGTILAFPGSGLTKAVALATGGATEALDLSEGKKLAANLTLPAMASLVHSIATRRYIPPAGIARQLYNEGKQLGMTDAELAPILATEGQVARHGSMAAGVRGTKQAYQNTGEVLGNVIEDMQNRPTNLQALPQQVEDTLLTSLRKIENDLTKSTHSPSPREQSIIDFVSQTIRDIEENGSNLRQLIGTWRSINQVGGGRTALRKMTDSLLEAIKSVDPVLAKDLKTTNALYSRYLQNLHEINPTQFNHFVDAGELQQLLNGVFSGNPMSLGKSILNFVSAGALKKISSSILTNPTAQSLVRNFGKAVRDGKGASARAVFVQLRDYVQKNLPEESKEIDWDGLESTIDQKKEIKNKPQ